MKQLLALFLFFLSAATIRAQSFCASDELLKESLTANPALQQRLDALEDLIAAHVRTKGTAGPQSLSATEYIIPVVVYVIHSGVPLNTLENISDQQINSQIAALNQAFSAQGIRFCLASMNSQTGAALPGPTQGIIRIADPLSNHLTSQESALKALSTLPGDKYLRIWVVKDIDNHSGIAGYARFPGSVPPALEGIVMRYDVFGDITNCTGCPLLPNYDRGKILAHEVGHYLGLFHTFQGGCTGIFASDCATAGDKLCDTPQIAAANTGCPSGIVASCDGTPSLLNNEMDYTNDVCRNAFTGDQTNRMLSTLAVVRQTLVSPQNLVAAGVQCLGGLTAAFQASNYSPCANAVITFTAVSTTGATYSWDFGDGSLGTGNPVTHTFTSAAPRTVTLTVTGGSNSVSSSQQVFVTACTPIASSQGNWYFGRSAGLNFSSGTPVAALGAFLNNTINTNEGCASQSDSQGNLLFYSDGISVWNANHALLNPSTPLTGHGSSSQSALSVPVPGIPDRYYLFTVPSHQFDPSGYFAYSIISTIGGNATLLSVNIAVPLPSGATSVSEAATAIQKCNGDYWVIVRGYFNDGVPLRNSFFVYSVTATGVSLAGTYPFAVRSFVGQLKMSPNGRLLACSGGAAVVCDFDRTSGVISHQRSFNKGDYGISFSPDSRLFYIADWIFTGHQTIYQYDLLNPNPQATEQIVSMTAEIESSLQIGPDQKLYVSLTGQKHLATISYPNSRGMPGFTYNGPTLVTSNQTITSGIGLPNMIDALPPAQVASNFSYVVSSCLTVDFTAPACATSYSWDFGDFTNSAAQNPTHVYSSPGSFTVKLTMNGTTIVTQALSLGVPQSATSIYGPLAVCPSSAPFFNYSANGQSGFTYQWAVTGGSISGLGTNDNVDVVWSTLPGTLLLTVTDPLTGCVATKTVTVTQNCNPLGCVVPPPSLADWWTFDEVIGSTAHDRGGFVDNAAAYVNGPNPVAGLVGAALEFDGVQAHLEVPDQTDLNFYGGCSGATEFAEAMTIDVWVHANNAPGTGPTSGLMTILDKRVPGTGGSAAFGYHLFLTNGRLGFQINGVNYVAPASGQNYINVADNQWHFVAVSVPTCRGIGSGFLYVDGKNVGPLPRTTGFVNTAKLYIGGRDPAFGSNFFLGSLDELEIFKRALSEDELRAIFEARNKGKCKADCSRKTLAMGPAYLPFLTRTVNYYPAAVLTGTGGTAPYSFAVTSGTLPPSMVLIEDGRIVGTPSVAGTWTFTVTAIDADGCRSTRIYQLTVLGRRRAVLPAQ